MLYKKYENLKMQLKNMRSAAIAFSGGVDSTFLLQSAYDVLGRHAVAITANSLSFPKRELKEANDFTAMQVEKTDERTHHLFGVS